MVRLGRRRHGHQDGHRYATNQMLGPPLDRHRFILVSHS
jgi:hypothetical protein